MKLFKNYYILFFAMFIFVGCEKENIDNPILDNSDLKGISFPEFINSKENLEMYINNVVNFESTFSNNMKNKDVPNFDEVFFDNYCSNLLFEDFEEGRIPIGGAGLLRGPLTENSDVGKFIPGEIVTGLKVSATPDTRLVLFGLNYKGSDSKVIVAPRMQDQLVIEFPNYDVSSLSLEIYSFPLITESITQEVNITIIYKSGEVFSENLQASVSGVFFAVNGENLISQVRISSTNLDGFVGIDNISFGICEDLDGDGCPNEDDIYDNSDLEATVIIGDCDSLVSNRVSDTCGAYISDIISEIESGDYKNKGQFIKAIAQVTNTWELDGLITSVEKDALQSCAAKFKL